MADDKPIILNIETLNAIGARLGDHADSITNVAAHQMEQDIRLAARVCDKLAGLRFRVSEIAAEAVKQADPAASAIARDLRDALKAAEC